MLPSCRYVGQEPVLFSCSVLENIKYGLDGASDEDVFEAARQANAFDFVSEFADGFDTLCGEKGAMLSGEYFLASTGYIGGG